MTAKEIVKYYNKGTVDQVDIMHEVTKLLPKLGNDDFSIACLMATAYNAGRAEVEALPDNGGTLGKLPGVLKPTERPKTLLDGACAMLAKLPAEYQERAYDMVESMFIDWLEAQPGECTTEAERVRRKAGDDMTGTLKALINDELAGVTKPKTLEAIQAYARIARQREGRE